MKIRSIYYTIGILAAIAIGVDCAIAAAAFMSLAGGFYAFPILIALCCIATFALNSMLYFQDIPEAFQTLENDLGIPSLNDLATKEFWIRLAVNAVLYLISISSALTIGAFTYYSYTLLPATGIVIIPNFLIIFIPHSLMIVFCIAYVIGTFAILKMALDILVKNDKENEKEKKPYDFFKVLRKANELRKDNKSKFCLFLASTAATIAGCVLTQMTIGKGLAAAILLLAPGLSWAAGPLFAMFLIAELVFTFNAMLYLFTKDWKEPFNWKTAAAAIIAIAFNSTCNAAITKDSTKKFTFLVQSLGFVLSGSIMTKSMSEFLSGFWQNPETEWPNVYNAVLFVIRLALIILAILIVIKVIMPLIIPSVGIIGAFCAGTSLLTVALMADYQYFSKFGKNNEAKIPATGKAPIPAEDIAEKAATTKPGYDATQTKGTAAMPTYSK